MFKRQMFRRQVFRRQSNLKGTAVAGTMLLASVLCVTPTIGAQEDMTGRLPVPGEYEITTKTTYTDVPMPDTTVTTRNCLSQEDLEQDPASVFAGLPDGKSCEIGQFLMADGAIEIDVECRAQDGDMRMLIRGGYDDVSYQMVSDVTIAVGEQKVEMRSEIDATLLGDC